MVLYNYTGYYSDVWVYVIITHVLPVNMHVLITSGIDIEECVLEYHECNCMSSPLCKQEENKNGLGLRPACFTNWRFEDFKDVGI